MLLAAASMFLDLGLVKKFNIEKEVSSIIVSLTLQRGVTGTARMLHALTHSSISRQVREQM